MHILLVEDEEPKQRHIEGYLRVALVEPHIVFAMSVRGALDQLAIAVPDVLILDMSLPTFDIGGTEGGGRPQGFGGLEVIRNMELEEYSCPVIFITGYEAFNKAGGQLTLDALADELLADHPDLFRGIIHYNSAYGDWQSRLKMLIDGIQGIVNK